MTKSAFGLAILMSLGLVVSACSSKSNLGGDRLQVQNADEFYGHVALPIAGTLTLDSNGCWYIDVDDVERLVVFPEGYSQAQDGVAMVDPDGVRFAPGQSVSGSGGVVATDSFPGVPDGYWGGHFTFCDPDRDEVMVMDSMSPAG